MDEYNRGFNDALNQLRDCLIENDVDNINRVLDYINFLQSEING